ncbi:MAG: phenylalanine--tRNA ligase subunit beta [Pseudomonadota bacterium]|nr:phenylalanine--tRNA ligase subunit beta [Pseudomonadota bacterium]
MKFTLSWLKEHLETDRSLDEICATLSMIGLEVEGVEDKAKALAPFVVGYVTGVRQHPNADRLKLCTVDMGSGTFEVVCGAPNARAGIKGVYAPEGSWIPGSEMKLKKSKIRGVESCGMLCSERELELSDEHDGIIELTEDAEIGAPVAELLGASDPVIEIGLTPNRPDCAGVRGIARDLAAAGMGILKPLDASPVQGAFESPIKWRIDLPEDLADGCPMVVGRSFRGVTNGPSPKWLWDQLTAIGLRPISALVDITNYVTFGLARPLHVFDADKVAGDLVMRPAKPGEKVPALDGETYELTPDMIAIADDNGAQSIAGVMGGEATGCGDGTTNVFLEIALFDPVRTATTGRKLDVMSDARYRFERGVDPTSALWGAEVAARLILDLCGGEASELTIAGAEPDWARRQTLRKSRIAALGGVELPSDEPAQILELLGFDNNDDGEIIDAAIPPWRPDIDGEADLVEEVLRIHGYDNIPVVPMDRDAVVPHPALDAGQNRAGRVRRALAANGLVEAVTFSFLSDSDAKLFGGVPDSLRIGNPISADLDVMRPSVLPNLAAAAGRNGARGAGDAALFEIGPQYADATPDGQALVAAGLRVGGYQDRHWSAPARDVDAFDAKADALVALAAAGAPGANLRITRDAPAWYHPGRSGVMWLGKTEIARFGELHPDITAHYDLRGPVAAFEVFLDVVPPARSGRGPARPLLEVSPLQPVERDFAFVVDADTASDAVLRAARGADKKLITGVKLFDIFEGESLGEGKKSLAIAVTLQPTDATLTDAEIDAVAEKITAAVAKATGGVLRG